MSKWLKRFKYLPCPVSHTKSREAVPAPTAFYKLIPNKNNLCAGLENPDTVGETGGGGRRTEQSQKEGSVLMVNDISPALSRQTSALKPETCSGCTVPQSVTCALLSLSLCFLQTGFSHPSTRGDFKLRNFFHPEW